MKHASDTPELENGRDKVFRRQDPVSCQFCRRKKLKCDRAAPCSNCLARHLTCSSAIDGQPIQKMQPAEQAAASAAGQTVEDLNLRVRILEDLLARKSSENHAPNSLTPQSATELVNTVPWEETDAYEHTTSASNEQSQLDANVAESFGALIFSLTRPRTPPTTTMNLENLPTRSQGEALLDYYFNHVNWIYQIVHEPTVRGKFDCLYTCIHFGVKYTDSYLALISTIFALSAYFSGPTSGLYFKHSEALLYTQRFTVLAQEALFADNCLANPSIESLQSLILISQNMMPNMGGLATLRTLSATIMHTARGMALHQIDSPKNKALRKYTQVDHVELEVRRRIWMLLASTDWLLSFMSGAQCGTYMLHPKQMNVESLSNVDDDGLTKSGIYALPSGALTEMTYFIFRVRFATVYREMVDSAWENGCDLDELPYELVLDFDKRLNSLCAEFEKAYSTALNHPPPEDGQPKARKHALLRKQRDLGVFGAHTRFARLHRPYLVRGSQDPRYAYSRMVCLRSARTVIELGKAMIASSEDFAWLKMWCINHHVFVSAVILVMDYCFNREEPRAKERKEEILECFKILETGKHESTMASRGLQKLRDLLNDGPASRSEPSEASSGTPGGHDLPPASLASGTSVGNNRYQAPKPADTAQSCPLVPGAYNSFGLLSVQQNAWSNCDYFTNDNLDLNGNLDASLFDDLFNNIDYPQFA